MSIADESQALFEQEAQFHAAWQASCVDADGVLLDDPVALALIAGALADRLAWVFVSGYQAAVRCCFPELVAGRGWTCLAAAEARGGQGCVLTKEGDEFLLSGEKSWIAGAGVLDSLVVSVAADDVAGQRFVGVSAAAPGVSLELPRKPGFLGEMSQGVARFDRVRIAARQVLEEPARGLTFRGAEPLFVLLALNACLKSKAADDELTMRAERAIGLGRTLPAVLGEKEKILPGLAELRTLTAETLDVAGAALAAWPSLQDSWEKDARLFSMFGIAGEASA